MTEREAEEREERAFQARSALRRDMEAASIAYRAAGHAPAERSPDQSATSYDEHVDLAALNEARHLMRGRDRDDAEARMSAAEFATQDRSYANGRETSSRALADALSVMPVLPSENRAEAHHRRGILAQAQVENGSERPPTRSRAVPDAAMPPFGASHLRKGMDR